MKVSEEMNKTAGQTEQKLPGSGTDEASSQLAGKALVKPVSGHFAPQNETAKEGFTVDWISQPGHISPQSSLPMEAVSSPNPAKQMEVLGMLVSSEAFSLRQTGANELAVSLKLDAHTEIFLKMTQEAGQIRATIHCERGNLAGLESQWGQLQESLARHNIQLSLEKDNFPSPATNATAHQSSPGFSQTRQENQRERVHSEPMESPSAEGRASSASVNKNKINRLSRLGWESWA